jgi:hypothetical protein
LRFIGVCLASLFLLGCSTSPVSVEKDKSAPSTSNNNAEINFPGLYGLDFFSTYMSEEAMKPCSSESTECVEDPITPLTWFQVLQQELSPVTVGSDGNTSDYEILIASQLRQTTMKAPIQEALSSIYLAPKVSSADSLHSEFTLQWRGFALDTYSTSTALTAKEDYQQEALEMVGRWKNHAASVGIFTRDFLYTSLKASDYRRDLIVPSQLGEFYLEDTQLYADPFRGAISRYRHPLFENAILDITVSPILAALDKIDNAWLINELSEDLRRAELVAVDKEMALNIDTPISEFLADSGNGHYFSVHAFDEFNEPLYAATYLFRKKDKLIKFTSSFPHQVAEPLVREALISLEVPAESSLMEEIRAMF